jgi:PAS domain S-box-containing protein
MDILESIADSFLALDRDGRVTFITSRACEILGKPSSEILHRKLRESVPHLQQSELCLGVEKSLSDQAPLRFEHFDSGMNRWFEHQTYITEDGGVAVYGRDITARRRLEAALRSSENRFRRLVDSNVVGIVVANGSQITEANDYFLSIVGYSREDLVRHQIDWARIAFLGDPKPQGPHEIELVRKDGARIPVLIGATSVDETAKETLYVVHDLTHRKRAEVRLRQLVEATKILSSSLDTHRMLNDLARYLVSCVGECCVIYIREESDLINVAEATRTSDDEFPVSEISESAQLKTVLSKGTSEFFSDGIIVPLPSRGRIAGALYLGRHRHVFDHDDLHLLEEVGRRAGISLENTRLYHQTQNANRLKDEFVAALSHELRTPLTPILGAVYMLRAEPEDKRIFAKALDLIERNAKVQSRIIEDLLDVSRIINGKLRLHQEPVELENALHSALDSVRPAQEAKQIRVDMSWHSTRSVVFGDSDRLQQIFWNLLSNSVKFTPKGGRIHVEVKHQEDQVEVCVSDSGIGIAKEFLPFVFDRFRQEDTSRTRMHGGLGIGLAIVRHLVEAHGGTVHAHSPGDQKGATFVVKLPLDNASSRDLRSKSATFRG